MDVIVGLRPRQHRGRSGLCVVELEKRARTPSFEMPPWSYGETFEAHQLTPSPALPVANYRWRALGPFSGRPVACSFGGYGLVCGLVRLVRMCYEVGRRKESATPRTRGAMWRR